MITTSEMKRKMFGIYKMGDPTIKMRILLLFLALSIAYIQIKRSNSVFEYRISDNFFGPCVIFLYETNDTSKDNFLDITKELNHTSLNVGKKKFIFKSLESSNEIEIVPIGSVVKLKDNKRYIFRLVKGNQKSDCIDEKVNNIVFYVGTEEEFLAWHKYNSSEMKYIESKGIDWCRYYIKNKPH